MEIQKNVLYLWEDVKSAAMWMGRRAGSFACGPLIDTIGYIWLKAGPKLGPIVITGLIGATVVSGHILWSDRGVSHNILITRVLGLFFITMGSMAAGSFALMVSESPIKALAVGCGFAICCLQ
jgi:hypothetical protein